jgi:hypothetical protein
MNEKLPIRGMNDSENEKLAVAHDLAPVAQSVPGGIEMPVYALHFFIARVSDSVSRYLDALRRG